MPFSDPTHPPLCWRNTWMVPYKKKNPQTKGKYFAKHLFCILAKHIFTLSETQKMHLTNILLLNAAINLGQTFFDYLVTLLAYLAKNRHRSFWIVNTGNAQFLISKIYRELQIVPEIPFTNVLVHCYVNLYSTTSWPSSLSLTQ